MGRWIFFADNRRERWISEAGQASAFWVSYQRTLYQSYGMVAVCFLYIPHERSFFSGLLSDTALVNGVLLGVLCLATAFLLITYADSSEIKGGSATGKLSTKIKGLSQQIELILALVLGHFVLRESLGRDGLIGCIILVLSYLAGVLYSERSDGSGHRRA